MKYRLLEFIRCPACRSRLRLEARAVRRVERASAHALRPCTGLCPFPGIEGGSRDCSTCASHEVMAGSLACSACGGRYPIDHGVPRLCPEASEPRVQVTDRTASSYGYLWSRSSDGPGLDEPRPYHFERAERSLTLDPPGRLVLDAGCGEGIDLRNLARRPGVEVIGVELSTGGCDTSFERSRAFPGAHVVQADLCRLPFEDDLCSVKTSRERHGLEGER